MPSRLKDEIKQARPFPSLEAEVFLNLMRTVDALARGGEEILKLVGLSLTQYNVLRILRGAGAQGLCCREVAERMAVSGVHHMPVLDRSTKVTLGVISVQDLLRGRRKSIHRETHRLRVFGRRKELASSREM